MPFPPIFLFLALVGDACFDSNPSVLIFLSLFPLLFFFLCNLFVKERYILLIM